MKWTRENIKDLIYAVTIILGVLFFLRDEAKDDVTVDITLTNLVEDVSEIKTEQKEKFKEYDKRWEESIKADTYITTLLGGNPVMGTGSSEEGN